MVGSTPTEPVLCVALAAVEKIRGDEDTIGGLWSVFTKVTSSVADGRRLENITWRLWHRARVAPKRLPVRSFANALPRSPETLPRPLSSPSLSLSSSSEGTGASSDWDHDTAIGDDDDLQFSAPRNSAASLQLEKALLQMALGSTFQQARVARVFSPALPSQSCHHVQDSAHFRISPSAPSDSTLHQPPQPAIDTVDDASRPRAKGVFLSESPHHPQHTIPDRQAPSSSSRDSSPSTISTAQHPAVSQTRSPTTSHTSPSQTSPSPSDVFAATLAPSSMPIILPSLGRPHKDSLSVGRIIAELFPNKLVLTSVQDMARSESEAHAHHAPEPSCMDEKRPSLTPTIIEPQPATPPQAAAWLQHGNTPPPVSNSAMTSNTSTPRQIFPTVVIVNPTPHPTPPATPSPGISDAPFGLKPSAMATGRRDCPDSTSESWDGNGPTNIQLATPVSMNGCARAMSSDEPSFVMVQSTVHAFAESRDSMRLDSKTSALLPAAAIALPEKPTDLPIPSHLPTPSSDSDALQHSEMHLSKSTTAPIPAAAPPDDRKFFLAAAPSGGSGPGSSASPDSFGTSVSPVKGSSYGASGYAGDVVHPVHADALLGARDVVPQTRHLPREEEIASSFSASSPSGGRPASITSSRGGSSISSKLKGRAGGSRRKPGSKKVVLVKQEPKMETAVAKAQELGERTKAKGKERQVGEAGSGPSQQAAPATKTSPNSQHRPQAAQPAQSPPLRHLPSAPPRQHASAARRPSPKDQARPALPPPLSTRPLPYHPQFGHLGLHLPTVPPRQRRPIEITETSSEYETTDTDGEESSWESESCSGDDGDAQTGTTKTAREKGAPARNKSGRAGNNRTRDAGEFARDAALEAQRARELFQKLPPRSYSHLGQLPRTKSGLSQLFRPDPELFPEGHPYRTTRSSHDILARNWSAPAPPLALSAMSKRGAVAEPMADPVHATSVSSVPKVHSTTSTLRASGPPRSGYRRKGKPDGQEDETDSGNEDPENAIQVSNSVVQRRLAAIMGQRSGQQRSPRSNLSVGAPATPSPGPPPASKPIATPVMIHPYLPDPAPLQTPHTVRRNIISQELDEELRRNLLWERSQNQIHGRPPRAPGSILPGPWLPLNGLNPEAAREMESNPAEMGPGQRSFATQRTKSWAGEYHASGW